MKKIGPRTKEYLQARAEWKKENPPDFSGYWYCVVGGGYLDEHMLTVDHDIARTRDPSKRADKSNFNAMCGFHNNDKGSRSLAEYRASKPRLRCGHISSPLTKHKK